MGFIFDNIKTNQKIKALFILPNLHAGGAERVFSFVSQNLDKTKFIPEMLVIGSDENVAYDVSGIKVTYLNKDRVLSGTHLIIEHILKSKPDVVLSSVDHMNVLMGVIAPLFIKTKFIIRVASVLSKLRSFSKKNKIHQLVGNLSTRTIDRVICQSSDMAKDYIHLHPNIESKIRIIGNPITFDVPNVIPSKKLSESKEFITVGRLSPEKGHLRLLEILKNIKYEYHYTIVGEGPQEQMIKQKVKEYGLEQNTTFIPFTKNVSKYLLKSDYFLQGSYVEGFPNALLESCSHGIPVIAFNAPGGTKEIIVPNLNGILAENEEMFQKTLEDLNFSWNAQEIKNSVYEKYSKEQIINQYENLIFDVIQK
ncbi:MAG: glycosyltransferase [Allomuricauda sp.]